MVMGGVLDPSLSHLVCVVSSPAGFHPFRRLLEVLPLFDFQHLPLQCDTFLSFEPALRHRCSWECVRVCAVSMRWRNELAVSGLRVVTSNDPVVAHVVSRANPQQDDRATNSTMDVPFAIGTIATKIVTPTAIAPIASASASPRPGRGTAQIIVEFYGLYQRLGSRSKDWLRP